ncbi:trimethylamine methyltransferase family protein, partial [Pseudomonas sp.]
RWKKLLADYQPPELDPAIDAALLAYIEQRKASMPDSNV